MTVTTQLIGKLGGGGAPEMQETVVSFSNIAKSYYVPSGWKKALATFSGTASSPSPIIFGQWLNGLMPGTSCSGGGVVTSGTSFLGVFGTITWVRLE